MGKGFYKDQNVPLCDIQENKPVDPGEGGELLPQGPRQSPSLYRTGSQDNLLFDLGLMSFNM